MVSVFIVFFAALFALICFVVGTTFKGVYAIIDGGLKAVIKAGSAAVVAFLGVVVLALISPLVESIIKNGFMDTIGFIIIMILILSLVGAIVGGFGSMFVAIALAIVEAVCNIIGWILAKGMEWSEVGYLYSLEVIFDYVNED